MESLEAFRQLERLSGASFQCDFSSDEKFSLLEISRDYTTLTRQEIALITSLVAAEFGERLVLDDFTDSPKEEQDMQDEIIENMLEDTKFDILPRDLIGFRENGRVFVYNKTS
ncbi:MAG: hypothetical protein H0Z38_08610 [Firmicutes bacterium]|nr:hypothetical protein [Bacillota bacterium]